MTRVRIHQLLDGNASTRPARVVTLFLVALIILNTLSVISDFVLDVPGRT